MARPKPYYVGGKRVPSVTTITGKFKDSGGLIAWANMVGRGDRDCDEQEECEKCGRRAGKTQYEAMEKAADVGTYAHALIEAKVHDNDLMLMARLDKYAHLTADQLDLAADCLEAFDRWWSTQRVEIVETELRLVSDTHKYGGTMDLLATIDGKFALVDWKTSRGIYGDYLSQLAGYLLLVEENGFPAVEEIHILRIAKETAAFHHSSFPRRTFQPAVDFFLTCRKGYEQEKAVKKLLR
jgi:hypothetical protein